MSKVTESKEKSANEIKFMYNKIEALLNLFDDVNEAE